jgi:hypothetical protein
MPIRHGLLKGLRSDYESIGLGTHEIEWAEPPVVGQRFMAEGGTLPSGVLLTGPVTFVRPAVGGWDFRTAHTVYRLRSAA